MDFIHNNNISNSILIIGNGFDLDLRIIGTGTTDSR